MTTFHFVVFVLLGLVLVLLFFSRRPPVPKRERDDRIQCNICGERFEEDEVIEREFISGYTYFFCKACVEGMSAEFITRSVRT